MTPATTEHPVPGWAYRLARVIPLLTLPSGLWRLGLAAGFPMGTLGDHGQPIRPHGWEVWYIVGLSLFAEAVALSTTPARCSPAPAGPH